VIEDGLLNAKLRSLLPMSNWWKVNTDGSLVKNPQKSACGGIFRNSHGFTVGCFAQSLCCILDLLPVIGTPELVMLELVALDKRQPPYIPVNTPTTIAFSFRIMSKLFSFFVMMLNTFFYYVQFHPPSLKLHSKYEDAPFGEDMIIKSSQRGTSSLQRSQTVFDIIQDEGETFADGVLTSI
jgi:hypothetical protein